MLGLASKKSGRSISSYTIGFSDPEVTDERPYAQLAAKAFGSEHHETTIGAQEFADFLPKYVWHMEEPVCEPPAVALYYVSKLARDYVKVLISGEGGDEAFAGYSNYRSLLWMERVKRMPSPLRQILSAGLVALTPSRLPGLRAKSAHFMESRLEDSYFSRTSHPARFFNR